MVDLVFFGQLLLESGDRFSDQVLGCDGMVVGGYFYSDERANVIRMDGDFGVGFNFHLNQPFLWRLQSIRQGLCRLENRTFPGGIEFFGFGGRDKCRVLHTIFGLFSDSPARCRNSCGNVHSIRAGDPKWCRAIIAPPFRGIFHKRILKTRP